MHPFLLTADAVRSQPHMPATMTPIMMDFSDSNAYLPAWCSQDVSHRAASVAQDRHRASVSEAWAAFYHTPLPLPCRPADRLDSELGSCGRGRLQPSIPSAGAVRSHEHQLLLTNSHPSPRMKTLTLNMNFMRRQEECRHGWQRGHGGQGHHTKRRSGCHPGLVLENTGQNKTHILQNAILKMGARRKCSAA